MAFAFIMVWVHPELLGIDWGKGTAKGTLWRSSILEGIDCMGVMTDSLRHGSALKTSPSEHGAGQLAAEGSSGGTQRDCFTLDAQEPRRSAPSREAKALTPMGQGLWSI